MRNPVGHLEEYQLSDVVVDGERWTRASDLSNAGPDDSVFMLQDDGSGGTEIRFGDGKHGRRPPPGSTVGLTYRAGANQVQVAITSSHVPATPDQDLWVAIRNRTYSISFGRYPGHRPGSADHARKRFRLCMLGIFAALFLLLVLITAGR